MGADPERLRFLTLLDIVRREGEHLLKTDARLFDRPIDVQWVARLADDEDLAERLDAFVARFGRMQDTLGDKLLPSLLRLMAERPGSMLDNLNRAEQLGRPADVGTPCPPYMFGNQVARGHGVPPTAGSSSSRC